MDYQQGYTSVRKCILIEIRTKFNLIHEKEWTGDTISNICKRYNVSRKTYYKWKSRCEKKGIEDLSAISRRPHNIKYRKVMPEVEETIIDLRLTKPCDIPTIWYKWTYLVLSICTIPAKGLTS
jgi:transposase